MEEQFILRVPPKVAEQIRKILRTKEQIPVNALTQEEGKKKEEPEVRMQLAYENDKRTALFQFGDEEYLGTLVDLPCVIESQKTYDNTNYYKSADIGQMLLIHDPSEEVDPVMHYDSEYKYSDGITPPARNIRKRKFRKIDEQKRKEISEVEPEIWKIMRGGSLQIDESLELVEALGEEDVNVPSKLPLTSASAKLDCFTPTQATTDSKKQKKERKERKEKKDRKEKKEKKQKKMEVVQATATTPTLSPLVSPAASPLASPATLVPALYSPAHTPSAQFSPMQTTPSSSVVSSPSLFMQQPSPAFATSPSMTSPGSATSPGYLITSPMSGGTSLMSPSNVSTSTLMGDEEEIVESEGLLQESYKTNPVYLQLKDEEKGLDMELSSLEQKISEIQDRLKAVVNPIQQERYEKRKKELHAQASSKKETLDSVKNKILQFEAAT